MNAVVLLVCFVALVLFYLLRKDRRNLPPNASGKLPIVGAAVEYGKDPCDFLIRSRKRYGNVFEVNLIIMRITFLVGDHANRFFFGAKPEVLNFMEGVERFSQNITGSFLDMGQEWLDMGPNVVRLGFHSKEQLTKYSRVVKEEVLSSVADWKLKSNIDLFKECSSLIMSINIRVCIGDEFNKIYGQRVSEIFYELEKIAFTPIMIALGPTSPTPTARRVQKLRTEMFHIFESWCDKVREEGNYHKGDTYLDVWLRETEAKFDSKVWAIHALGTIFAAHTNSAGTIGWTIAHVASNQRIQNKLREELSTVLDLDSEDFLDMSKFGSLTYLDSCFREAVRKYSQVILFRKAMVDFEFEDKVIPAGSFVCISPYLVHHDEKFYPEPEEFKPERWLDSKFRNEMREKNAYVQFGFGSHRCLGEKLATMEARATCAALFALNDASLVSKLQLPDYQNAVGTPFPDDPIIVGVNDRNVH